ncbi:MAG TPA: D-aminoacyl-tRNA deacylase [Abditibacteriaceae bacterium]|nr:D-aminoacyl-tRNA deacylase [Abditibacteriaceae bacterium]
MKIVIQRCTAARVEVEGEIVGGVAQGLALFVGLQDGDDEAEIARMARKVLSLRVFNNDEGRFDRSLTDIAGGVLAIPNFTLCAQTRKGARPNFSGAAPPETAQRLFERFVTLLRAEKVVVATGTFGAHMTVLVENDGPVSIVLSSDDL